MDFLLWGIAALFSVIGWLLSNKDKKQGEDIAELKAECKKEIDTLYLLHHEDEAKLAELRLMIAQNHYTQPQVDLKLQQTTDAMRDIYKSLSADIKELSIDIKELTKVFQAHLIGDKHE